jgi:formamidopyrimidine-DNA glycosylase
MPELPEVETARRWLQRWAARRRITGVVVREPRVLGGGPRLGTAAGARFRRFERRGKHLLLTLDKGGRPLGLWSHLGMTGKWLRRAPGEEPPRFSRVELVLDNASVLHYVDLRLFGRLRLVAGAAFDQQPVLAALGPDVLGDGIDRAALGARLGRSPQPIKVVLMDQRVLAGIGNIQASEALFRARLDPRRPARSLAAAEVRRLATGIEASIAFTLARFESELRAQRGRDIRYVEEPDGLNPFKVYDRAGERCPRCRRAEITRIVQATRATFFCPRCQTVKGLR